MTEKEVKQFISRVKALQLDLEQLGAWTELKIYNLGDVVEIELSANFRADAVLTEKGRAVVAALREQVQ